MTSAPHAFARADAELFAAAKDIRVLQLLDWEPDAHPSFMNAWREGRPQLPRVPQPPSLRERAALFARLAAPQGDHPAASFLARTARSYELAVRMLDAVGTPEFRELSIELYGQPSDCVLPGGVTNLEAAEHFIQATEGLEQACAHSEQQDTLSAEELAERMRGPLAEFFSDDPVGVEVAPGLLAKAAAREDRVRLRAEGRFSELDLDMLLHHEAYVHTATLINGRRQTHLRSLGLAAPRTTATQEGLATFAELICSTISFGRLRRLALRVKAIHMGLEGADFVEVFEFFRETGNTDDESFFAAARVFRGGDPRGGVVFTKDSAYLHGLLATYGFLHGALTSQRLELVHYLFAGRLTWGDVLELAPLFEQGLLAPARYLPSWAQRRESLGAYLSFFRFTDLQDAYRTPLEEFRH